MILNMNTNNHCLSLMRCARRLSCVLGGHEGTKWEYDEDGEALEEQDGTESVENNRKDSRRRECG